MLPLPNIVAVEPLPDGRKVVTFDDRGKRRDVVFGIARQYPHPVRGCEWISTPARPCRDSSPAPRPTRSRIEWWGGEVRTPEDRSNQLLESLLDPVQLASWRVDGTFWVESRRGPVQLGRLYALIHHPFDRPDDEVVLCVVPDDHGSLPMADIWANLVLVLGSCPDAFFDVAVVVSLRRRSSSSRWCTD